jgi:hypothetical protein
MIFNKNAFFYVLHIFQVLSLKFMHQKLQYQKKINFGQKQKFLAHSETRQLSRTQLLTYFRPQLDKNMRNLSKFSSKIVDFL